ncbi:hypothetical protein ASG14_11805 [Pedobacter sp. Leaf194]|nr:hypothetical protein ASG14_11805 [Pedobacter sp. Leaf194]
MARQMTQQGLVMLVQLGAFEISCRLLHAIFGFQEFQVIIFVQTFKQRHIAMIQVMRFSIAHCLVH